MKQKIFMSYVQTHFAIPKKTQKLNPNSSKYKSKLKKFASFTKVSL